MSLKYGFNAETIVNEGRLNWDDIETIRKWSETIDNNKIPKLTDEQIVCFLLSCDNQEEFAKKTIQEYYNARHGAPELFNNRNVENEDLQQQLKIVESSVFPARTDDGSAIVFHRLQEPTYSNYHMEQAMKILFMTLDISVYDNPPTGLIILFDMKGIGLMHLTRVRIGLVKKFCHYLQEGLPVKLKAIHVLNSVYFVEKVMAIIKPFMKKEVMDVLYFHPCTMDMEIFYEKCIPKNCLPSDLGGDLPNVEELNATNTKKLESMLTFFEAEEKQREKLKNNN